MKYYIIAAFFLGVAASIGYQGIVQKQTKQAYAKVISIGQPVTLSGTNALSAGQFIDTANTAYFLDPASSTNSLIVNGKVGIGTTAPSQSLEVAGNIKLTGTGNSITFPDATVQTSAAGSALVYKRIFVTSTTYTGNLGGLSGADAKCQTRADAASLGGTYKAILSATGVNAKDRIGYNWDALVTTDGIVVFTSIQSKRKTISDVSGFFHLALAESSYLRDETGQPASIYSWSDTTYAGLFYGCYAGQACSDWTSGLGTTYGCFTPGWAYNREDYFFTYLAQTCNFLYGILCIEQ